MYSKDEASQIRQAFWTAFGQYIAPQLSADGLKINWVNYKTGIRHVFFKMDAQNRSAGIGIIINHPDTGIQELFYEQFIELKHILTGYLEEEWIWSPLEYDASGRIVSRIYTEIKETSIFNREDWPKLISFFKPRIIALDEFWSVAKYSFDPLK
jgi:YD repeat-containing protein